MIPLHTYAPVSLAVAEGKDNVVFVCLVDISAPSGMSSSPVPPCLVHVADTPIHEADGATHCTEQVKEAGSPSEMVTFDWPTIFTSKPAHKRYH